ncbi:MAG: RagB/SusD family nutrient uptake outer membrane protein [Candidatus Pedobacter colombiensis]|uniref:RagB/SusD family nutrient uptake outer membrane protein n=1 Tax=Candidatus Pedobacter colombiensis TaxID=3121371 RepID=A0AAJ5W8R5_9SPHI|nr:RagB/SusD family nutrient uptake outer membrane protein [Pedobacter sp.]WEK20151.1 MAG: RagB/SusD family nutrient uptake outer membrane protein [Pedobacter sp.]
MNRNIKHTILALMTLISVLGTSCKKWLDLQPQDGLIREKYWQTKEQLDAAVMGCYASLLGGSTVPLAKYLFIWGELRGDMVVPGLDILSDDDEAILGATQKDEFDIMRTQIASTNSFVNWEAVYKTINYCNTVIKFGPDVINKDKTLTKVALNAYLAEAHSLRGLLYFYLLRSFGEVPLKLEPTYDDSQVGAIAKKSKEEVYQQVIADLTFGVENGQVTFGNMMEDRGRMTKFSAYAALADAYLWNEEYQKSIDACNKVIESGKYQLLPQGTSQSDFYTNVFLNGNSVESIFEFQFDNQKLNPFWPMFGLGREVRAADWISEGGLFGTDAFDSKNIDIRGNNTSMLESNSSICKYTNFRTSATSYAHWFVYRFSDVLLMKAEALTWLSPGNTTNAAEAIALVEKIRTARHALYVVGDKTIDKPDPAITENVSQYILNERAREFAFEGKRWYDILRNAKRNNYANEKLLLDIVSASADPRKQQTIINKYKDHRSHYFPIYSYELQTNKALVQNPFYP